MSADRLESITDLSVALREVSRNLQAQTRALEAAALTYETAVEAAPTAMLMVNDEGVIVLVNRQAEALFGYDRRELMQQSIELLVPDAVKARHPSLRERYIDQPDVRELGAARDLAARRKDGSEVPVEIGLNPIETTDGTFVLATVVDITERGLSDERFRLALEAAPNAMLMVNSAGKIVLVNRQAERLFGYRRSDLVDQAIEVLVPAAAKVGHPALREGFMRDPDARVMGAARELTARHRDGSEVPVEIGLNPIETAEDMFVVASVVDISERKLSAARAISEQRAKQRSLELEEFSYLASHDLRQPLNTVISFSKLLSDQYGDKLDQVGQDCLHFIHEAATRMSELIVDLLDYSQLRIDGEAAPVDCAKIMEDVLGDLGSLIEDAGATVKVGLLPVINGFRTQLRLLFQNLVGNAIKYRAEHTAPMVVVSAEPCDPECSAWRFAVQDNGIGIEPKFRAKIFEPFQRLHGHGEYEGTGIGLAHCKKVVELHHGSIWVDSVPGEGSIFFFTLPRDWKAQGRHEA